MAAVSKNNGPELVHPDQNANGIKEEDQDPGFPDVDQHTSRMKEENQEVDLTNPNVKEEDLDQDHIYQNHCRSDPTEEESPDSDFFDQHQWESGMKRHQDPDSHDPAVPTDKQVKRNGSGDSGFRLDRTIRPCHVIYCYCFSSMYVS